MLHNFVHDRVFEKHDFFKNPSSFKEFENCAFKNCNFANVDLSQFRFIECEFKNCDLSMAVLGNTIIQEVTFNDCKMLGMRFDTCDDFGFSLNFENCQLNHSSFYEKSLKNMRFKDCQLQETDFVQCDLTNSVFENCDLTLAVFNQTILEKVDFRTSYNYSFDPEKNRIKKAKFNLSGVAGLLVKYDISIQE